MLIDNELLYIGSANMNLRTFRHDIENGIVLTGPVVQEFNEYFENFYLKNATALDSKQNTNMLYFLLIKLLDVTKVH